jgi:hypothetical protein
MRDSLHRLVLSCTVLSHDVAMTIVVGACSVPFSDSDDIPSCGGLGNLTSFSRVAFFGKFI